MVALSDLNYNKTEIDQPLISIIINCFNGEKYLVEALNSVLAQTYENWEIVFWDNKSTDKSAEIFQNYKDDRFKYYRADLHASILYKARKEALKKTKGDFIAFLDVDDWWVSDKLEKQMLLFKDPEVGLVYGNFCYFFENKKKIISNKKNNPTGMILGDLLKDYIIKSPTYIIRKNFLTNLKLNFNEKYHIIGEFDLILRLAASCKIDCVQMPIAYVRLHDKNESLLNRYIEIEEMRIWYNEIKNDPTFSSYAVLGKYPLKISYLETMQSILQERFSKSFLKVLKYPFCFDKIKLLTALLLPKSVLKKIKNY